MRSGRPTRRPPGRSARRPRSIALVLIAAAVLIPTAAVVGGALVGVLGHQSVAASSTPRAGQARAVDPPGEADGLVPTGVTVFDRGIPAVDHLDPSLLGGALRRAASDAADDGIEFVVTSGWRSPAYQEQLLREAVVKYGSAAAAARWVATPETSAHVSGDAVDLGGSDTTAWLSRHGARFGLCRIYRNEPWHFELRREAVAEGCPAMYADPTHDPRMHDR